MGTTRSAALTGTSSRLPFLAFEPTDTPISGLSSPTSFLSLRADKPLLSQPPFFHEIAVLIFRDDRSLPLLRSYQYHPSMHPVKCYLQGLLLPSKRRAPAVELSALIVRLGMMQFPRKESRRILSKLLPDFAPSYLSSNFN